MTSHARMRSPRHWIGRAAVVLTLAFLYATAIPAPAQTGAQPAPSAQGDDTQEISTLEVFLPIVVFDKENRFVPGLTRQNFRIFEDGKEQTIRSFDAPTQLPLHIGILLDTSSSVKRKLKFEQDAAAAFVLSILRHTTDKALFGTFDSVVTLHVDFTRDSGELTRAIDSVKASGNTRLYDAVYSICEEKMSQLPAGVRPVVVVITDGADTDSDHSLEEAIALAQKTNVTIFGISTRNYSDINAGTVRGSVDKELERLCVETGGRTYLPYQRLELEKAFSGIRDLLRNQYVIYYEPENQQRDGKFRKIEIKLENVDQKVEIRAKKGYFAQPITTEPIPR